LIAYQFAALVLVVAFVVFRALWHVRVGLPMIAGIASIYLVVPAALASRGLLDRYDPLPAPALVMVAIITALTLAIALSSPGARVVAGVGLPALVGFQAFRIPLEWILYRLYQQGVIPVQMTYAGRNFDIVTGVTAAALAVWLLWGRPPKRIVLAWNILGLALLANIVTIAVLSTPVPFRQFGDGPPNTLPSLVPYVWLPTFLVQLALAGHLLLFRRLAAETER
jgi:hypothetical protein